jgi:hypothetical protein
MGGGWGVGGGEWEKKQSPFVSLSFLAPLLS